MFPLRRRIEAALTACLLACAGSAAAQDARPEVAFAGTIPVYWGEAAGIAESLEGEAQAHWARSFLETQLRLQPVSFLDSEALAGHDRLLLAQPRALGPEENVALDAWIRDGGRLLLLADPMMTGESRFALGDRRRPQDVALLSPILSHWGLELTFDGDQPLGLREIAGLPVNLPGRFRAIGEESGTCTLGPERIVARCPLGEGYALVVADAALLDIHGPHDGAAKALEALVREAFAMNGEFSPPAASGVAQATEISDSPEPSIPSSPPGAGPEPPG